MAPRKPHPEAGRPALTPPPSPADPPAKLIDAARAGDRAALERLLEPETERLYAICLRMLGRPDQASDAAQDALVRVIRGLEGFDGRARFTTWTTRIAMNVCLTRLRDRQRRARLDPAAAYTRESARAMEPGAPGRVQGEEDARLVAGALADLSEEHRAVLVLRDIRGMDHDQIAEVLGLPLGTVKSRVFRARAALRELVDQASESRPAPRSGSAFGGAP